MENTVVLVYPNHQCNLELYSFQELYTFLFSPQIFGIKKSIFQNKFRMIDSHIFDTSKIYETYQTERLRIGENS